MFIINNIFNYKKNIINIYRVSQLYIFFKYTYIYKYSQYYVLYIICKCICVVDNDIDAFDALSMFVYNHYIILMKIPNNDDVDKI